MTEDTKRTIQWLINNELEKEFEYQQMNVTNGRPYTDQLLRDLIQCERELYRDETGPAKFAAQEIINEDIEKYIKALNLMAFWKQTKKEEE